MARTVGAAARALDVLEAVAARGIPLTVAEISARVAIPRSTLHELLWTLRDRGYLSAEDGSYSLGLRLFELGSAYRSTLDVAAIGEQEAQQVVDACQETSQVGVLDGTHVVYVAKVDGTHTVRMVSEVGRRLPATCTGLGKALLADLAPAEVDRRYPRGTPLPSMTPTSITDRDRLAAVLAEVRRTGVAADHCESNLEVCCVAAPVRDATGRTVAAISISVPISRWDDDRARTLSGVVADAAHRISLRLGCTLVPPVHHAEPGRAR